MISYRQRGENAFPIELRTSVESFLSTILQYDFVKVIISCRTEYYNIHFESVGRLFEEDTLIQKDINSRLRDDWDKLKELYFDHFSIECQIITDEIRDEFCANLLLFRIFCEVNYGKRLYIINSIAKEPLFDSYCELMIKRVVGELKNEGYGTASEPLIKDFLQGILKTMVEDDMFQNLPLASLFKGANAQHQIIINRFLDNNVMVRKDLMPDNRSPFKNTEVVNFTFDEFRDYLVSHYLVDKVLNDSRDTFRNQVTKFTDEKHFLSEGVRTFLFFYVKREKNAEGLIILKTQKWYKSVFKELIWDLDEACVDDDDVSLVKEYLNKKDVSISRDLVYWGRWNIEDFSKLNIKLLLDYLSTLDSNGLREFFDEVWSDIPEMRYHWDPDHRHPSPREILLKSIRDLIDKESASLNHPGQRTLFELVLYLSVVSLSARKLYEEYMNYINDVEQVNRVAKETCSKELYEFTMKWL